MGLGIKGLTIRAAGICFVLLFIAGSNSFPVLSASSAVFNHVSKNFNVDSIPSHRQQVEPSIAVDPRDSSIMVASAQDYRLNSVATLFKHRWNGVYRSTDGGKTWTSTLTPGFPGDTSPESLASPIHGFISSSDPVVAFDSFGNAYFTGLAFNDTKPGGFAGVVYLARYSNDGSTYNFATIVDPGGPAASREEDKQWIAVDNSPSSAFFGNVYMCWSIFDAPSGQAGIYFARSINQGVSFEPKIFLTKGEPQNQFCATATSPNGEVYVVWEKFPTTEPANKPFKFFFSKSLDGGVTFATPTLIQTINQTPDPLPNNQFRTDSFPAMAVDTTNGPNSGIIYITWAEWNGVDSDVMLIKSANAGATWSSRVRVDDATRGSQFLPVIAVSASGVHIVFYDFRNDFSGTFNQALDVFYAQSIDGGNSFLPNVKVTSQSFDPNLVKRIPVSSTAFLGDYIGITATDKAAVAIWADNRNALQFVVNGEPLNQDTLVAVIS